LTSRVLDFLLRDGMSSTRKVPSLLSFVQIWAEFRGVTSAFVARAWRRNRRAVLYCPGYQTPYVMVVREYSKPFVCLEHTTALVNCPGLLKSYYAAIRNHQMQQRLGTDDLVQLV